MEDDSTSQAISVDLAVVDPEWLEALPDLEERTRTVLAAALAAACGDRTAPLEVAVRFTHDAEMTELNRRFRDRHRPANVLSFAAFAPAELEEALAGRRAIVLGDIVLARQTVIGEAEKSGRRLEDHLAHLLVHGLLHLLGYDHLEDEEARVMEGLERDILEQLRARSPEPAGAGR